MYKILKLFSIFDTAPFTISSKLDDLLRKFHFINYVYKNANFRKYPQSNNDA